MRITLWRPCIAGITLSLRKWRETSAGLRSRTKLLGKRLCLEGQRNAVLKKQMEDLQTHPMKQFHLQIPSNQYEFERKSLSFLKSSMSLHHPPIPADSESTLLQTSQPH